MAWEGVALQKALGSWQVISDTGMVLQLMGFRSTGTWEMPEQYPQRGCYLRAAPLGPAQRPVPCWYLCSQ